MSRALACVVCGCLNSVVRNTKTVEKGMAVVRNRTCKNCGTRYLTVETFERIVQPRSNRVKQPKIIVQQNELWE